MSIPPPGLLQRVRQTGDPAAWARLVDLYSPLLFLWACRAGMQASEAVDLVREVFAEVVQKLPEFRASTPGAFRVWLRGLAHGRRSALMSKRPTPAVNAVPPGAVVMWEAEYLPLLLRTAVDLLQGDFPPLEWKVCQAMTIEGRPVADVARELGVPPAVVYAAEARCLARLRQELDGLLD
jgi:RNA polymerase sigma-70 factor (ECF subfamily)